MAAAHGAPVGGSQAWEGRHAAAYAQLQGSASSDDMADPLTVAGAGAGGPRHPRNLHSDGRMALKASMRAALCAGLLAAAASAVWLRGSNRRLRHVAQGELEIKATWVQEWPSLCGKTELDVEYVDETVGAWGTNYDHIPSPEMCCAMCQGNPNCSAFTWVKDAGLDGCPSQCWLKGSVGKPKPKVGVVSGVPPPRPVLPLVPTGVAGPAGTLYCFSLVVPTSYEPGMLLWQHAHKASIFACDGYGVYSNKKFTIAPGVVTLVVDSNLKCKYGGDSGTALNAWIFIAVWKEVMDDGSYKNFDWVVKVDPDCVFFPDRLGKVLQGHEKKGYINNCRYGMHGPIEVFSSDAINILAADYKSSWDGKAPKKCVTGQDFGLWGEDMFLDQCLGKVLKITPRPLEPDLMCEAHCDCPAWYWCQNGTDRVSYHPFKTPEAYEVCMANALGGKPGPPTPKPAELATSLPLEAPAEPTLEQGTKKPETGTSVSTTDAASTSTEVVAQLAEGACKDAVTAAGTAAAGQAECAEAVVWAKEHGVFEHPEWYNNSLSGRDSYGAFQQFLFESKKSGCPAPCTKPAEAAPAAAAADPAPAPAGLAAAADPAAADPAPAPAPAADPGVAVAATRYPPGPRAQTFYMYRAQSQASYPLENINTADLAGVMWYLHNEVISATPRKYHIDRIKRYKVTVKNTWEFWNAHKRQFGAFMAFDAARCSTPICKKVYRQYGFIVGCQVCDINVAAYLAKSQTNWNCKKGADQCRAPLWYSLPGPCPSMGISNEEIAPNKVGLDVNSAKTPECIQKMHGGHCPLATGAPDCTYSYEEAGEIMLDQLVGIGDYNEFWNTSFTKCAADVAQKRLPAGTRCIHKKEYVPELDKGVGMTFWDGIHDTEKCTERMDAVRKLFKLKFPAFPESLEEPPCEFDMYYDGEFDWNVNHTGAAPSAYWDTAL